ncbi:hypothetical protein Q3G72_020825 [Acer saccharum]|nr:hypothetical protein Q3G72_020825 [Acer saccharum]
MSFHRAETSLSRGSPSLFLLLNVDAPLLQVLLPCQLLSTILPSLQQSSLFQVTLSLSLLSIGLVDEEECEEECEEGEEGEELQEEEECREEMEGDDDLSSDFDN